MTIPTNVGHDFQRIGARAQVVPYSDGSLTRPGHVLSLDIATDDHGEYFDIRLGRGVLLETIDADPVDRHLLLSAQTIWNRDRFLCGHDEFHWFVAGLPLRAGAQTIDEAKEALKPDLVKRVEGRKRRGRHTMPEHEELKVIAKDCITKFHGHHYLGFAATQWKLFRKEDPPRVKPLLYIYRVLLTGIHLMRSGAIEANLLTLNETAKLPYIDDLVERKLAGQEKGRLDNADIEFHEQEYERLVAQLEAAMAKSTLPEQATGKAALNDLLVRLRIRALCDSGK